MKKIETSIKHLKILDEVFGIYNHPLKEVYLKIRKKINGIDKKWALKGTSLSEQLYVGGKKGGKFGYGRHMILADIIEYIFTGRLYYFFLGHKNDDDLSEKKSDFFRIVLLTINQLLIWDSITVEHNLRKEILVKLEENIDKETFFKDENRIEDHKNLLKTIEDIGFPTPKNEVRSIGGGSEIKKRLDEYVDSLLPKTGGGLWNELIVYINLLKSNVGYVLPLLLTQRIYSFNKILKPPDFIIIDYNGEINSVSLENGKFVTNLHDQKLIGVEVGGGKEFQSGSFSGETKQPSTTTENTNIPPRCPICGKWILFCKKVIKDFSNLNNPITYRKKHIKCLYNCEYFDPNEIYNGECPNIQYYGNIDKSNEPFIRIKIKFSGKYHYHYSCIKELKDPVALNKINEAWTQFNNDIQKNIDRFNIDSKMKRISIVSNYPYISGVEVLEMYNNEDKMICFSKYDTVNDKRNCLKNNCKFSEKCCMMTKYKIECGNN